MEEMDIVNEKDEVVGQAPRNDIYGKALRHRIVHIMIKDDDKIALQLRSKHMKFCPNHWCTAVGGHVQAGESYEDAANREMQEEIGIKTSIVHKHKDLYESQAPMFKFLSTFEANFKGPFNASPREVEKVQFFSIPEIQEMLDNGEKFHPELTFLLKKHYGIK